MIELLVVIAIIGILSSLGLTMLNGGKSRARDALRQAAVRQYALSWQSISGDNGKYVLPNSKLSSDLTCEWKDDPYGCTDLELFFGSSAMTADPLQSSAEVCVPNGTTCNAPSDVGCRDGANWTNTKPTKYCIAYMSDTVGSAGFGLGAFFETGTSGIGGKGFKVLHEDGEWK